MDKMVRVLEIFTNYRFLRGLALFGLVVLVHRVFYKWRTKNRIRKRIAGKVVLVTGASSGLGEALAKLLHSLGSKVILASQNRQKLEQVKGHLDEDQSPGLHSPKILHLDLRDADSLSQKAREAVELFGQVDILVNNAGVGSRGAGLTTSMETDRKIMEVNFFGTIAFTKGVVSAMVRQGGGHVVVISSIQGRVGLPMRTSYSASKHALQGYFDSLRCELFSQGVGVTVVSPGYISTQFSVNAMTADGSRLGVMERNTARGMSPDVAARSIVEGVANRQRDIVLAPLLHQLAIYLDVLAPSLLDWMLRVRERFQ